MKTSASRAKDAVYVCTDCGRCYKAAETLNRHRKNHQDGVSYDCHVCDTAFKRKDLLDRHLQIHDDRRIAAGRDRGRLACIRCNKLKTRCDGLITCDRCARGGHECVYKQHRKRWRMVRSQTSDQPECQSADDDDCDKPETNFLPEDPRLPFSLPCSLTHIDPAFCAGWKQDWGSDDIWFEDLSTELSLHSLRRSPTASPIERDLPFSTNVGACEVGADEMWLCDLDGRMRIFDAGGEKDICMASQALHWPMRSV